MQDKNTLLNAFKEYLELHHRAPRTIDVHLHRLTQFFKFIQDYPIENIHEITTDYLKEYQRYRFYYINKHDRHDSVRTQNRHLSSIKCFFNFLKNDGYIVHDPSIKLEYAKEPKLLPKTTLNNIEIKKILNQPDTQTLLGYRDRTILEILYSTGVRKSELMNLKIEDVDVGEGYLRVNLGKGGKDRVTPLGKIACKYLETYLKGIRPLFLNANKHKYLFLSQRGNPISKNAFALLIEKYARESGINKPVTTHTFRRSCATSMIKNNANVMHVKDLLGHSSMESIQAYCNLSIVDLKKAHKKFHPREKEVMV